MNRKTLAAAIVLAASAGAAFAEGPVNYSDTPVTSSRARAEVQAEVQQRATQANPWAKTYNPLQSFTSTKTRAQVSAEYVAARDTVAAFTGEDSGSAWLSARKPVAAPVIAGQPVNAQ